MIVCNQVMKFILDRIDKDEKQDAKRRKKEEVVEQKRRMANASKLSSLLYRHKESLKTEILKKRALLDKELQLEAQVWREGGQKVTFFLKVQSSLSPLNNDLDIRCMFQTNVIINSCIINSRAGKRNVSTNGLMLEVLFRISPTHTHMQTLVPSNHSHLSSLPPTWRN